MVGTDIILIALAMVLFGLVSARVANTSLTAPMVFVLLGIAMGERGHLDAIFNDQMIELFMSITLALVLFTDASRINLRKLSRTWIWPLRLLGIGLILVIVLGAALAALLLPGITFWEAVIMAIVLAPTDAALGAAVINDERVPESIRQTLNVESGLNDGLALPLLAIALALAESGTTSDTDIGFWFGFALEEILVAVAVGLVVGGGFGWLIARSAEKGWIAPLYLKLAGVTLAILAFFTADELHGSGFIAAFVAGAAFGYVALAVCEPVHDFAEAEGQGLVMAVFVIYGALVVRDAFALSTWQMWVYAVGSLTIVRMIPVAVSLLGTGLTLRTKLFLGWFGPRGLASMLFMVLVVGQAGPEINTPLIQAVVAITVFLSVMLHGMSAAPAVRTYGRYVETSPDHDILSDMAVPDIPTKGTYGMGEAEL